MRNFLIGICVVALSSWAGLSYASFYFELPVLEKSVTQGCENLLVVEKKQEVVKGCNELDQLLEKSGGRHHVRWVAPKELLDKQEIFLVE